MLSRIQREYKVIADVFFLALLSWEEPKAIAAIILRRIVVMFPTNSLIIGPFLDYKYALEYNRSEQMKDPLSQSLFQVE